MRPAASDFKSALATARFASELQGCCSTSSPQPTDIPLPPYTHTLSSDACPSMSIFLVSALQCLGTSATLIAAMLVGLEGWRRRSAAHIAYAPAVHFASGLLVRMRGLAAPSTRSGACQSAAPANLVIHRLANTHSRCLSIPKSPLRRWAPSAPAAAHMPCPPSWCSAPPMRPLLPATSGAMRRRRRRQQRWRRRPQL